MRFLFLVSLSMTALGILLAVGAKVFGLGDVYLLGGILLAWAGLVKIGVVQLWTRVANMGSDQHRPIRPH